MTPVFTNLTFRGYMTRRFRISAAGGDQTQRAKELHRVCRESSLLRKQMRNSAR
jgi:hypothetical protein